jgi:threonine/homoserine/homoserine lactone efflux protein
MIVGIGFLIGFLYSFLAFTSLFTVTQITIENGRMNGFLGGLGHTFAQMIWSLISL